MMENGLILTSYDAELLSRALIEVKNESLCRVGNKCREDIQALRAHFVLQKCR